MFKRAAFVAFATAWVCVSNAVAAPCAGFVDVDDTHPFCAHVAWIKNRGITLGCASNLYCPNDLVSRLTMAAFLRRLGDAVLPPTVLWVANVGGTFDSIQEAIDHAVTQGASEFNPYVVKVAPGGYVEQVLLRDGIDVVGSGPALTLLTSAGLGGTVTTGAKAELRGLRVENTRGNPVGIYTSAAIYQAAGGSRLNDVTIRGVAQIGPNALAVLVAGGDMTIENSTIRSESSMSADALVKSAGRVTLRNVTLESYVVTATQARGIIQAAGELTIEQSRISAMGDSPDSIGILINAGQLAINNSSIQVQANGPPATPATGIVNKGTAAVRNVAISGLGPHVVAIANQGSADVHGSVLNGTGTTSSASFVHTGPVGRIAHSQLIGATSGGPTCFNTYGAAFAAVACP